MDKFRLLITRLSQNTTSLVITTVALCLLAILATAGLFLVNRYFYPPSLNIRNEDIADKITLITSMGTIEITVDPGARFPAAHFTRLARSGFYTGTRFHRIVPNLLIEGGDPLTRSISERQFWGQGGLGNAFTNEIHRDDRMTAGVVGFSGSGAGTFGSQFFILTKDTPWMKGKHTIIGHVTQGMDVVGAIGNTPVDEKNTPKTDIIILEAAAP